MLDGFLTKALEFIIILDVFVAIIYVLAVSLRRAGQNRAESETPGAPATPGFGYGQALQPALVDGPLTGPTHRTTTAVSDLPLLVEGPPTLPEWAKERSTAVETSPAQIGPDRSEQLTNFPAPQPVVERTARFNVFARVRQGLVRLVSRVPRRRPRQKGAELDGDQARLARVLDSFREDV